MKLRAALLLALSISTPAAAQGVQARFEAATAKLGANDAAGALKDLDALESFLAGQPKPNQFNLAVTRAMRAEALVALGRADDARRAVDAALDGSWLERAGLEPIRDSAQLLSAKLFEGNLDHAAAAKLYLAVAERTKEPATRATALIGAARTEMFVDAPSAFNHIDAAVKLAESDAAVGKAEMANILGLKGRILINGGRYEEAKTVLVRAVDLRGGLTARTDMGDASLRADAGIAYLRLNRPDLARKYLAFSGAGVSEVPLPTPLESPLPPCGGEADIRPDDVAVIEFTVLEDGRVVAPRPIFASRQGEMAYVFARAVGDWSWDPEKVREVKLFFRYSPRVELRCTNKAARPSLMAEFEQATSAWLAAQNATIVNGATADVARQLKQRLDALPAGDRSARRLALLIQLQRNAAIPDEDRRAYGADAIALARSLRAPQPVLFLVSVDAASVEVGRKASTRQRAEENVRRLRAMLASSEFADPRIRATISTMLAGALAYAKRPDEEIAALRSVVDDKALPERDPLKVAALVALANAYAARQDFPAAQAAYARTGLTAQQCALLDNGPVLTDTGHGNFPADALQWGFDGWTSLEYDVAADGKTRNARIVSAFPPQVFAKASENLSRTVRYRVSFRPESDTACTAMERRIRFMMQR